MFLFHSGGVGTDRGQVSSRQDLPRGFEGSRKGRFIAEIPHSEQPDHRHRSWSLVTLPSAKKTPA
jgi:hypothetical protein